MRIGARPYPPSAAANTSVSQRDAAPRVGVAHLHVGLERRHAARALVGDEAVDQPGVVRDDPVGATADAPPTPGTRSVGPFSTAPRTSGDTATTGAAVAASASAIPARPGSARSRSPGWRARSPPRSPRRSPPSPPGAGAAGPAPSTSTPSTGPRAPSRIMNSWKPNHSPRARTWCAPARRSAAAPAPHAQRRPQLLERLRQPRALRQPPRALQADREVAVAEVEPHVLAELAQRVHDVERVAARPQPRASMRSASQNRTRSGSGETCRRGSRRRRRCWRSPRGPSRPRRASRARAWRRPCRPPAGPRGSSRRQRIS